MFHNKRRLLRHLADQKDNSCIGRLSTNFAPCFHGIEKSKYGKGSASSAAHRTCPPREEDRRPVQQCEGPLLDYGLLHPLPNPSAISFTYIVLLVIPVLRCLSKSRTKSLLLEPLLLCS